MGAGGSGVRGVCWGAWGRGVAVLWVRVASSAGEGRVPGGPRFVRSDTQREGVHACERGDQFVGPWPGVGEPADASSSGGDEVAGGVEQAVAESFGFCCGEDTVEGEELTFPRGNAISRWHSHGRNAEVRRNLRRLEPSGEPSAAIRRCLRIGRVDRVPSWQRER